MSNARFDAVMKENDPMCDVSVTTENDIEYRHNEIQILK